MRYFALPRNRSWIAKYAKMNLGFSIRDTFAALEEMQTNSLVLLEPRIRNKKSKEYLYHYVENAPFSVEWLNKMVIGGVAYANSFDNLFRGFSGLSILWKLQNLREYIRSISLALGAINLLVALNPRKKYRSERKILLKAYHLAFKVMRKDNDYELIFPMIRYDLKKFVLEGLSDVEHPINDKWPILVNLNPKIGEKYPGERCTCTHEIDDHEVSATSSKCGYKDCDCAEFQRVIIITNKEKKV